MQHKENKQMSGLKTVIVAINGRKNSKFVVDWALNNHPEDTIFKLLYVTPEITYIPTPIENIPISQVSEDIAVSYRQEVVWKNTEMLDVYKRMFVRRKVQVEVLCIEADDIKGAIANEVGKGLAKKLVIGASSRGGIFKRKVNGEKYSSRITEIIPSFCTVYAVSKGKLALVREASWETSGSIKDVNSVTGWNGKLSSMHQSSSQTSGSIRDDNSVTSSSKASSLQTDSAVSENSPRRDQGSATLHSQFSSDSPAMQTFEALSTIKLTLPNSRTDLTVSNTTRNKSLDIIEEETDLHSFSSYSDSMSSSGLTTSFQRQITQNHSWISDTVSEASSETPSENELIMSSELEKLKIELLRTRGMYAVSQSETLEVSRKLNEMTKSRIGEQGMPKEVSFTEMTKSPLEEQGMRKEVRFKDEPAEEVVKPENEKYEDAKREANYVSEYASQREALERKEAETKSAQDTGEKENLQVAHFGPMQQYKKFTWEEIVTATSSFSEKLIIGKGAAGTVYKCNLHHTTAAVKVLHSRDVQTIKQFQQELEILSSIRHPYLVLLLGACPEQGCLVYEYMENGSLEDRLLRKNNKTNPIPWFDRFRIAWEIASGLVFLHNSKPKQIIHRDLKPANILLDHNLGSKIGDVGLSKMVQSQDSFAMSMYNQTALVGTLSYIDPEYQRTGLNSSKSDVYAFGLVILQLLTAKSTTALTHIVETAVDEDNLSKILDRKAGEWPLAEARELAILGLRCAELRRRDRPNLKDHVLPKLEILRAAADRARDAAPPNHFLCPILKEVMKDPCVAADGYTYDRKSIQKWLGSNDTSPMTNVILPTKNLIPNFTLLSAISQWKSERA